MTKQRELSSHFVYKADLVGNIHLLGKETQHREDGEKDQGGWISVLPQQEFKVEDQERPDDTLRRQLEKLQYKDKQVGGEVKKKLEESENISDLSELHTSRLDSGRGNAFLPLDQHFCVCGVHAEIQTRLRLIQLNRVTRQLQ